MDCRSNAHHRIRTRSGRVDCFHTLGGRRMGAQCVLHTLSNKQRYDAALWNALCISSDGCSRMVYANDKQPNSNVCSANSSVKFCYFELLPKFGTQFVYFSTFEAQCGWLEYLSLMSKYSREATVALHRCCETHTSCQCCIWFRGIAGSNWIHWP